MDTVDSTAVLDHLQTAVGVQVFSDGGFQRRLGAAAFVGIVCRDGCEFKHTLLGARACLIHGAKSAFHAEVSALDMACEFLATLSKV